MNFLRTLVQTKSRYWFGDQTNPVYENYSRVSTCLALSQAVYVPTAEDCVTWLSSCKDSLQHGISEIAYSVNCERQYLLAFKPHTKEIYVTFRGTESWKALLKSFKVYCKPNDTQGMLHAGYLQAAQLIPLAPFCHLLREYLDYKLIFTGHSLGGAVAAIVTINMLADLRTMTMKDRIFCVAFGSPLIANDACSTYIDQRYQKNFQFYINHNDIVPFLLTFAYNVRTESLTASQTDVCERFLSTLSSAVQKYSTENESFFKHIGRILRLASDTDAAECLGLIKNLLVTCCDVLKLVLPKYQPFGLCYHTQSYTRQIDECHIETEFSIESVRLQQLSSYENMCGVTSVQDHFIKNYITDIHENVILKYIQAPKVDYPTVALRTLSSGLTSPLCALVMSVQTKWKWKNDSPEHSSLYSWSIVISKYEKEQEITLRLHGPNVAFITELKCEGSDLVNRPVKPQDSYDECVRLFVFLLKRDIASYHFFITSHFDTYDITLLFDPRYFVSTIGMQGRRRQVADLTVLELYKLAFAYCAFTGDVKVVDSGNLRDEKRRNDIEHYLLLSEQLLNKDCKKLENGIRTKIAAKKFKEEQLQEILEAITYAKIEGKTFPDKVIPKRSEQMPSTTLNTRNSLLVDLQFFGIKPILDEWRRNLLNRSSTETVIKVVPKLFCMNIALIREFDLKLKISTIIPKRIGLCVVGGCVLGLGGGFLLVSTLLGSLGGAAVGSIAGGLAATYLKPMHAEYLKILLVIAESLGVILDEVRMHQYSLEEKISEIYCANFKRFLDEKQFPFHKWENYFPGGILKKLQRDEERKHCLDILVCIDANFQIRKRLCEDFAVGVVGPGKTGKSTIVKNMFGFNTNPDKEARTVDLCSYRVNDEFRIVDFPHSTSVFDRIKHCFRCNHTLVNAIIVVLNAEQGGNDKDGEGSVVETVEALQTEGVDVLYCFTQCDKIALKKKPLSSNRNADPFSSYRSGDKPNPTTTVENNVPQAAIEDWTENDVKEKKLIWCKNYNIDPNTCFLTFCELEETDEKKRRSNFQKLSSIKLYTHFEVKKKWLREVLKRNSLSEESINEIMNFRCN